MTKAMVTIRDVARLAGVSPGTVSRVLNGSDRVTPETTERVRAAIERLNYSPSAVARGLRVRATRVWGVVLADIENPFFTSAVRAIQDVAWAAGYSVVLCNSDEDPDNERRAVELLVAQRVAGVIVALASETSRTLEPLFQAHTPVVAIDRRVPGAPVDTVLTDNREGARNATLHLVEGGYRRVACITGPRHLTTARDRLDGYLSALGMGGRAADPALVRHENFKEDGGYRATQELLALDVPPDAIFVANNLMTLGALEALDAAGLRVGEDIALVGFDDLPWSSLVRPRITTVAQPTYEIGRRAAELLVARVSGDAAPLREVILAPTLKVRESSPALVGRQA